MRPLGILTVLLATASVSAAEPAAPPAVNWKAEYDKLQQRNLDEAALNHQRLVVPKLSVWDGGKSDWRSPLPGEIQSIAQAKLRILHFWAPWCPPCEKEFPLLRDISRNMMLSYAKTPGMISFTYISVETDDSGAMVRFLAKNKDSMPIGLQFGDYDKELRRALVQFIPQAVRSGPPSDKSKQFARQLPLPVTLVLDEENIVRMAFVGSLEGRQAEFVNGVESLRKLVRDGQSGSKSGSGRSSRHSSSTGNQ